MKPTDKSPLVIQSNINELKFFQKHIIEGVPFMKCAKQMNIGTTTLAGYKKRDSFRDMALAYLEDSTLGGVKGSMNRLVDALDATKPHNKETVNKDGATNIEVIWVADQATRMKALQELNKIYGVYAPTKKDITVEVSMSSDADLFKEIDEAERKCKFVDSYVKREGGFELAPDPQERSSGNFESRKRAILQDATIQEPE